MIQLLAQIPITGDYSGWVGTGLLGSVLSWLLLRHLPEKDRQIKEINDSHVLAVKLVADANTLRMDKLIDTNVESTKYVANENTIRIDKLANAHIVAVEKMIVAHDLQMDRILDHCKSEMSDIVADYREMRKNKTTDS